MTQRLDRRSLLLTTAAAAAGLLVLPVAADGAPPEATPSPAPAEPPAAPGPIRLGQNENPWGPSPAARAAAEAAAAEGNRYPFGVADFEALLARREGLPPQSAVVAAGSHAVLCTAALAFGRDGEVVSPHPTYPAVADYAANLGLPLHRVPLASGHVLDLPAMEAKVSASTRLVYVCNPNNPTGTVVPPVALRAFCERVARKAVVVVDEAYGDLASPSVFASVVGLVRDGASVVVTKTFSKVHGLAGLRIGYALARKDLAERLRRLRMGGAPLAVSNVAVAAARASLDDEPFLADSRRRIAEGRARLTAFLKEEGFDVPPSEGNFVYAPLASGAEAVRKGVEARGVRIREMVGGLRVSVGTSEQLDRFFGAFREARRAASATPGGAGAPGA